MKKTYSELLKDPRWQKKRLEIFSRDNFTCRYCGNDKETLNVHHLEYNGNPWEVDNDKLITSCKTCHSLLEYLKTIYKNVDFVKILTYNHNCKVYVIKDKETNRNYVSMVRILENGDIRESGGYGIMALTFMLKSLEDVNNG